MIKHIWFDFSGTINPSTAETNKFHNEFRYSCFAKAVEKPMSDEIVKDYNERLEKYKSNSAVFYSLGLPSEYWANCINSADPSLFARLHPQVVKTLIALKEKLPISLFTNIEPTKILKILQIDENWFTHIIKAGMIQEPKPSTEGFKKLLEMTKLPAEEILYVGDSVEKDIKPAKSLGIKTCLVWSKSSEADYSFENFEDILSII
jgi:FMN phosphatase YigB (HAD superfamily)